MVTVYAYVFGVQFDVGIKSSGVLKTGGVLLMKKLGACPEKAGCLNLS